MKGMNMMDGMDKKMPKPGHMPGGNKIGGKKVKIGGYKANHRRGNHGSGYYPVE